MPDPYTNPDAQPAPALAAMMTRLEERGRHAGFRRMIGKYAGALAGDRPLTVLDLGCGTGVVARELACRLCTGSVCRGADISEELLKQARALAGDLPIQWDHIGGNHLPYDDNTFDAVVMHTLLSHVPQPVRMLEETKRVLKPDGRLIVFDADHAGTTYGLPDYMAGRRIDHLLTSAIATHPDICRQLPRLLKAAGFELVSHDSDTISECGRGDFWLSSVQGFARLIPTIGALSPAEADAWVSQMLASHEDGTFFAAGTFYTFFARPRADKGCA